MTSVLVTGGKGFIGSHLALELSNLDSIDEILIVDSKDEISPYHRYAISQNLNFHFDKISVCPETDFADQEILHQISEQKGFDAVFHLAAWPQVQFSIDDPVLTNEENVHKTVELINAVRQSPKTKFIFSSSSAVYGNNSSLPTSELEVANPESPYGLQKLIIDEYLNLFAKLYGMPSVSLRYFNVFGPGQTADNAYSSVIASWIQNALSDKDLIVYGDGEQTRDFIYVKNVVEANIKIYQNFNKLCKNSHCIYNVGSGYSVSLKSLGECILYASSSSSEYNFRDGRSGEVRDTLCDNTKMLEDLGLKLDKPFIEHIQETVKWWEWYLNASV